MSLINKDAHDNIIEVIRGKTTKNQKYKYVKQENSTSIIYKVSAQGESSFAGFQIGNYYDEFEKMGAIGEEKFASMLERNNIPYLYIGQNCIGIDKSNALLDNRRRKRPDFLVNLRNIGSIFFDVKVRIKDQTNKKDGKHFYLYKEEIDRLQRLNNDIMIPVWIAFCNSIDLNKSEFHLIPISKISEIKEFVIKELKSNPFGEAIKAIRIPYHTTILSRNSLKIEFDTTPIEKSLLESIADSHVSIIDDIKDSTLSIVNEEKVYKTGFAKRMMKSVPYAFSDEFEKVLELYVQSGIIAQENHKALSINANQTLRAN